MTEEQNQNPPGGAPEEAVVASPRRWWILVALSLATIIIQFDQSGMTLALPHIQAELGATTQQLQWVMDAYSLALASVVLTAGAVSDRYGRRKVFLLGIAVLATGSLIGALAPDANVVIAGRALMGVGGAMFMPGTLSIITHVFDRVTRPTAIGIWGAVTSLGVIVGPLISGAVLQIWHWRGIFVLNVVMAAIAFTGAAALVPESRDPHPRRLDILGAVLAGAGLLGVIYAVIHSSSDGVTSPVVLAAAGVGAAALVLFWLHSTRGEVSMFDLGVARNPAFLGAALAAAVTMFTMAGLLFMITQQFQLVDGFGVLLAGVAVLPMAGGALVASLLVPLLVKRLEVRTVVLLGLALMGAAAAAYGLAQPIRGYLPSLIVLILLGMGNGGVMVVSNDLLMSSGPKSRSGLISSMNDTVQEVGTALGIAVLGAVLASQYAESLRRSMPGAADGSFTATLSDAGTDSSVREAALAAFGDASRMAGLTAAGVVVLAVMVIAFTLRKVVAAKSGEDEED